MENYVYLSIETTGPEVNEERIVEIEKIQDHENHDIN